MSQYPQINDGLLLYSIVRNNELLVGTNESGISNGSVYGNGFYQHQKFSGTLTIPDYYDNKAVTEIGQYAFTQQNGITNIIIGNNVVILNTYAFGDLPNLNTVYIPASVEYFYYNAIMFYNGTSKKSAEGSTSIYFAANSKLKFLERGFASKNTVSIFSPSVISPICGEGILILVENIYLYSSTSFRFCNIWFRGRSTCSFKVNIHHSILICSLFISK